MKANDSKASESQAHEFLEEQERVIGSIQHSERKAFAVALLYAIVPAIVGTIYFVYMFRKANQVQTDVIRLNGQIDVGRLELTRQARKNADLLQELSLGKKKMTNLQGKIKSHMTKLSSLRDELRKREGELEMQKGKHTKLIRTHGKELTSLRKELASTSENLQKKVNELRETEKSLAESKKALQITKEEQKTAQANFNRLRADVVRASRSRFYRKKLDSIWANAYGRSRHAKSLRAILEREFKLKRPALTVTAEPRLSVERVVLKGTRAWVITVWLEIADKDKDEIEKATYYFSHSGSQKEYLHQTVPLGEDPNHPFKVHYTGSDAPDYIVITLHLKNGTLEIKTFDK